MHHPRSTRPLPLALATLLALACALVGTAAPAAAHDVLVSTSPADGATVARTPDSVVLTFEEPALALGTKVLVTGPAGPAQDGVPVLHGSTVRERLVAGAPAGSYRVQWRVTSDDGHAVSGTLRFTSKAAGAGSATATSTAGSSATSTAGSSATATPIAATPSASAASTSAPATTGKDISNSDRGVPWWLIALVVLIGGFALVKTATGRRGRTPGPS